MAHEKKIIDASVIIKWFLNEVDSEKALVLRTEHIEEKILLIIPDLAVIEVTNVLRYKKWTEEKITEALKQLEELQLHHQRTNYSPKKSNNNSTSIQPHSFRFNSTEIACEFNRIYRGHSVYSQPETVQ